MKLPYRDCVKKDCNFCGELSDCEIWNENDNTLY